MSFGRVRTRNAGERKGDIGAQHALGPHGHRNCSAFRDHRSLGNPKYVELHRACIRHDRSAQHGARSWHIGQATRYESAGYRFGQPQGEAPFGQQVEYDGFHRVGIQPKYDSANVVAHHLFPLVQQGNCVLRRVRFGGEPHFYAFPPTCKKGQRRVAQRLELLDDALQPFVQPTFTFAPCANRATCNDRCLS